MDYRGADMLIAEGKDRLAAKDTEIAALVADRDALLSAAGFKPGPLTENNRRVILDDIAGMRPAMVIARREGQQAQAEADLWSLFCAETEFSTGETLLLRVWKRAKKAEAAMRQACALLEERTYGNPARSAGHNARLTLETALNNLVG